MSRPTGSLTDAIAAAVGDSPILIEELRHAFVEALERQLAALEKATTAEAWANAAHRLRGLAASFGADSVMDAAADAVHCRPGDRQVIARIRKACGPEAF